MRLPQRPAHLLASALCVGIALANVGRPGAVALAATAVFAVAAVVAEEGTKRFLLGVALLASVGWWWGGARLAALDRSPLASWVGHAGQVTATVTAAPKIGRYGITARGEAETIGGERSREPVALELPPGRAPPLGAVIEGLAIVTEPNGPLRGFDERTWLRRHGVHVVLRVETWHQVGQRGGLGGFADHLHRGLAGSIAPGLGGERRAVLEGIVLGDDAAIPTALRDDFQASGLYHLLAVSGQNVVLLAGGALLLAWLTGLGRIAGEVAALAGILGYVLAVGPQPSVIRAGVAGALTSLAWLTGRLRDAWYALIVAATVLLAWNPYTVYDPGFQLSFAAVAATFTVVPRLESGLAPVPLPRSLRLGVAVSAGCGLVTAPIVWLQFGYLPLLGVPANALAEPAMPVLLGLAFLTAALDPISPAAATFVAWLNGGVAEYIALCARVIGSLPFASIATTRALAGVEGVLLLTAYAWRRWRTS